MNRACAAPLWVLVGLGVGCLGRTSKGDETSASARGDEDGDGFDAAEDCDDEDSEAHPGAEELCDGDDNDCDGSTDEGDGDDELWHNDRDGDGFGSPGSATASCGDLDAPVLDGTDCDDRCADCHPGAEEVCDDKDNDCDDETDEDLANYNCYTDRDDDGYGDASAAPAASCDPDCGPESAPLNTDCDDNEGDVNPGEAERCDLEDQDCDGEVDDGYEVGTVYRDSDGDGYGSPATETWGCVDVEGYVTDGTDCEPRDSSVNPGAAELCNGSDDNCDGVADEGLPTTTACFDADGDGYGDPDDTRDLCGLEDGWVADTTDCGPYDRRIHPDATEDCDNGRDDDCDGLMDCEDDACLSASTCGEADCDDSEDDDDDGYTDCDDDECWGAPSCPGVVVSWVGMAGERTTGLSREVVTLGSSCDDRSSSAQTTADCTWWAVSSVGGSARVYRPGATAGEACVWGATRAGLRRCVTRTLGVGATRTSTATSFARSGLWVDGDCGLDAITADESGFLPALSTLDLSTWYGEERGGEHVHHERIAYSGDCSARVLSSSVTTLDEGADGSGAVFVCPAETTGEP